MQYTALFTNLGQGLVYAVITFIFIIAAKKIDDHRTTAFDDDHEVQENNNKAVGFRRTGLYIAYAVAFSGVLSGESAGFGQDIVALILDGVVITFCLFACRTINDRIMLANIDNDKETQEGNVAVGLSECGMYVATGFILNGSFTGFSDSMWAGILSAFVFFVAGQAALLIFGYCYEMITPFNVRNEIEKGNPAAGTALAGMLIALGIVLRSSIAGPTVSWTADFISFALYTVYGIVLLLVFRKAVDLFLLPGASLAVEVERDQNVAALALTASSVIAVAIIVSSVM